MKYLLAIFCLFSLAAEAQVEGMAVAVDGDTLEIAGEQINLHGIDAPELGQICERHGQPWSCGAEARKVLDGIIRNRSVRCRERGRDAGSVVRADCRAGPISLNIDMVSSGMALALEGGGHAALGAAAEAAKRGLWASRFTTPAAWRAGVRMTPASAAEKCRIKGDIRAGKRRYHIPDGAGYAQVSIEKAKGERWFCSEIEAVRAGWYYSR